MVFPKKIPLSLYTGKQGLAQPILTVLPRMVIQSWGSATLFSLDPARSDFSQRLGLRLNCANVCTLYK